MLIKIDLDLFDIKWLRLRMSILYIYWVKLYYELKVLKDFVLVCKTALKKKQDCIG